MEKTIYMTPEMEVVKLNANVTLLAGSNDGTEPGFDPNTPPTDD